MYGCRLGIPSITFSRKPQPKSPKKVVVFLPVEHYNLLYSYLLELQIISPLDPSTLTTAKTDRYYYHPGAVEAVPQAPHHQENVLPPSCS